MRKNKLQNLNEQLSRMKRLMNFDIGEHSHDKLTEQEYKKIVTEQNRTEMSRDEIIKNYNISGPLYDTIKGIKSVSIEKDKFSLPKSSMDDLYMDNYVTPNSEKLEGYLKDNVYPIINDLIDNRYEGTLKLKVDSGASSVPATNGYGGENPPNHNFEEYGKNTGGKLPGGKWNKKNPSRVEKGNKFLATQRGIQLIKALKSKLSNTYGNKIDFEVKKGEKFGVVGDKSESAKFVDLKIDGSFSKQEPTVDYDIDFNFVAEYVTTNRQDIYPYVVKISIGGSDQPMLTKSFAVTHPGNRAGSYSKLFYKERGFGMFSLKYKDPQGVRLDRGVGIAEQFDPDQVGSVSDMMKKMGFKISLDDVASALGWGLPKIAKGPFYSDVKWGEGRYYCSTKFPSINVNSNPTEWDKYKEEYQKCTPTYKKIKYETDELLAGLREVYGEDKVPASREEIIKNLQKTGVFEK